MKKRETKNILLIVDDDEVAARSARRALMSQAKGRFDEILIATSPEDAEVLFGEQPITSLLCDYHLGEGKPKGTTYATDWIKRFPSLQIVYIFTGDDPERIPVEPGIDGVLSKSKLITDAGKINSE